MDAEFTVPVQQSSRLLGVCSQVEVLLNSFYITCTADTLYRRCIWHADMLNVVLLWFFGLVQSG